ncbi:Imm30 family immunity protein [Salipaludibacillus sp. LMS25]|jgi:hypothetical protein|uniref:Imm30 family immunity protein n=1 Tax=Salipaludibacillus sp. LMS25 TaxID=2924031 RepID=UPI0020D0C490|nr:Imm30 family immunity protein [Salipaludibacillus sp. LMS25]UTR15295.1 Imm30 family immunity protein [Salipaludibacillus sp. LMS25]
MDIAIESAKLKNNRFLRNEHEIETFEQAIVSILKLKDPQHIALLCEGFDDSTENHAVMFGLVHAIESYDDIVNSQTSLNILANSIPKMLPHAKEWLKILHKRILNHEPSLLIYKNSLTSLNKDIQDYIVSQLESIKEKNPIQFEKSVNSILKSL